MLQKCFLSLVALMAAAPVLGRQAANLDIPAPQAQQYECGDACQATLKKTLPVDRGEVGVTFDFDFYDTAHNFTSSKPGDVLKFKPVNATQRNFKAGTTAFKFQYTSKDSHGRSVPATGFIAFPYSTGTRERPQNGPDSGGGSRNLTFPLVAYAHGTVGVFRGCAPSNGPAMFDYDTWQTIVGGGYAVVATDYAGLGNNFTTHKYLDFRCHAADVYYSVVAARKLFGHVLSDEWITVGHSQGGGAVWKLSESDLVRHDKHYLGAVALAPGTHGTKMLLDDIDNVKFAGYVPYLKLGSESTIPGFKSTSLAPKMTKRVEMAEKYQLCGTSINGLTLNLGPKDLFNASGIAHDMQILLAWMNRTSPALGARSTGPLLVVQGLNDTTVLPATTEHAWKISCEAKNKIHLSLYPGVEHSPLLAASQVEWMSWIGDRFSGRDMSHGGCTKRVQEPYNMKWANFPPELDL